MPFRDGLCYLLTVKLNLLAEVRRSGCFGLINEEFSLYSNRSEKHRLQIPKGVYVRVMLK